MRFPARGSAVLRFPLLALDRGAAEVTVLVRGEDEFPLASVRLRSEIVAADDHDQAGLARTTAPVLEPDPGLVDRPTLAIDEEVARGRSTLHGVLTVSGHRHRFRTAVRDTEAFLGDLRASLAEAREAGVDLPRPERGRAVEARLREIGADLADRLLDRRTIDLLWAHRDELDGLVLQTTGETGIPWELLVVRRPGVAPADGARFLGETGMVRWIADVAPPSTLRPTSADRTVSAPRSATEIASASVVALGVEGGAPGGAASAMRNGAGVVIECGGRSGGVGSDRFLAAFAAELASGAPVDRASRRAREAAREAGESCALAYAVYGHPGARLAT
ncbi:hypothetical protein GCM10025870_29630 [Agromyces marinus]|uniref:Uncharacterized protein n=1 Tax=Agromyces marinus TaxID=1389020 RepID=A0ABM8H574_9MICO|nr:hypothetical protein GCM10025870_29630 [Agromyces marinus]